MRACEFNILGWMVVFLAGVAMVGPVVAGEAKAPRTGEEAIRAALEETTTVDFIDVPLGNVVNFWREYHHIEIQIDQRALESVNLGSDTPVSKRLDGIELRSALKSILRELDLTWIIRDDILLITTPEEAETQLATRVYDVGKLVSVAEADGNLRSDFEPLIGAIGVTVEPESWEDVGGPGSMAGLAYRGADVLVVRQTRTVQEQVAGLLEDLARVVDKPGAVRTAEDAILAAMDEKTTVDFLDEPSSGVVDYFKERHHIEIQIDTHALETPCMGTDTPITKRLQDVSLRSALNLILGELDLDWIIRDEVLLITSPEEAERYLILRVYDVGSLLAGQDPHGECREDFQPLMDALTTTIEPESWKSSGGPGSIAPLEYQDAKVLIVRQTHRAHEEIARLLENLQKVARKHESDEKAADARPELRTGEAAILAALEEKTSVNVVDDPLSQVVDHFRATHKIEIQIDTMALDMVNPSNPKRSYPDGEMATIGSNPNHHFIGCF